MQSIEVIDLTGMGQNRLRLGSDDIQTLAGTTGTLTVRADYGDAIETNDDFQIVRTRVGGGRLHVIAQSEDDATLQISGMDWTNPLDYHDVNGSGNVSALDALVVINRLNQKSSGLLPDPASLDRFPMNFYDTSGDGRVTALDALRVINEINRRSTTSSAEPEAAALVHDQAIESMVVDDAEMVQTSVAEAAKALGGSEIKSKLLASSTTTFLDTGESPKLLTSSATNKQEESVDHWFAENLSDDFLLDHQLQLSIKKS